MSKSHFLSMLKEKKSKASEQNELQTLWTKIEKHQKRNLNFEKKRDKIFSEFQQKVEPIEHKQAYNIALQIEHFTQFVSRKTLADYERNELLDWIYEDLHYLNNSPFTGDLNVAELEHVLEKKINDINTHKVSKLSDDALDDLRGIIETSFDGAIELTDAELREIAADPNQLQKHIDKLEAEFSDNETPDDDDFYQNNFSDDDDESSFFDDLFKQKNEYFSQYDEKVKQQQQELDRLFKGSQLNKMYKRLASKLHPDKELDAIKKAHKHELMQQLSIARKNKDGFTLLQLYLQHFNDDIEFDSKTMENLTPLLQAKLAQLNQELSDLKQSRTPETLVWQQFNGRSKAIITANMENQITALKFECNEISDRIANCRTVKDLKAILKIRLDNQAINMFDFPTQFNGLFGTPF
ncbi:hypothetical protein CJF42_09885 [Pseudoalteromonas sp. NBT06-2]|uniref:hypothetical protein n=1 Tax=Pseudoalteromonas sp. NBT06-2 TaxID=2025950 RepID=UPI000BA52408|nr:hypothetical protein [Pseudoalteromonas sp. NBT06-2]PAJ74522.1 hypothetical protein CJF42_09885 [Pseudoalteromonas sp. NBT06-2]